LQLQALSLDSQIGLSQTNTYDKLHELMALNLDLQNRNNAPYSSVDTSTMDK